MRYGGVIYNDIAAAPGLCVSFFVQGCPIKCPGCHNPETQDFDGGIEFTQEVLNTIINSLTAQGIQRSFCLMGGEPLCDENLFLSYMVINTVKEKVPNAPIYIWSGYTYEQLISRNNTKINGILETADYLIDGPFIQEQRDLSLEMRGSRNQRIIDLKEKI